MKKIHLKHILFIGKSLLWSAIMYLGIVAILDWEEVAKDWNNQPQIVFVNNKPKVLPEKNISNTGSTTACIAYTVIHFINRVSSEI